MKEQKTISDISIPLPMVGDRFELVSEVDRYPNPQMTHEEKLINMEVALALSGAQADTHALDLIISMYELLMEKGVETRLSDIHEVKNKVNKKYKEIEP
jgi:hypothetical protein